MASNNPSPSVVVDLPDPMSLSEAAETFFGLAEEEDEWAMFQYLPKRNAQLTKAQAKDRAISPSAWGLFGAVSARKPIYLSAAQKMHLYEVLEQKGPYLPLGENVMESIEASVTDVKAREKLMARLVLAAWPWYAMVEDTVLKFGMQQGVARWLGGRCAQEGWRKWRAGEKNWMEDRFLRLMRWPTSDELAIEDEVTETPAQRRTETLQVFQSTALIRPSAQVATTTSAKERRRPVEYPELSSASHCPEPLDGVHSPSKQQVSSIGLSRGITTPAAVFSSDTAKPPSPPIPSLGNSKLPVQPLFASGPAQLDTGSTPETQQQRVHPARRQNVSLRQPKWSSDLSSSSLSKAPNLASTAEIMKRDAARREMNIRAARDVDEKATDERRGGVDRDTLG